MQSHQMNARFKTGLIYTLLIFGGLIFCWPLAWMAFTSVKMDRELFARTLKLLPETPKPQAVSPYTSPSQFRELVGPRQKELLPALEAHLLAMAPTLAPDLEPVTLSKELARGAYHRLSERLPQETWNASPEQLQKEALAAIDVKLAKDLASLVRRSVVVGQLRARSYDVQEDQLVAPAQVATAWTVGGSAKGVLKDAPHFQGAELNYDFSQGDTLELTGQFKTSFKIDRLYRLQLSLRADESWHRIKVYIQKGGQTYEAVRAVPMADYNWSVFTWQEEGPDELSNKIRTWVLLKPLGVGEITGENDIKITVQFQRSDGGTAWMEKIKRNYMMVFDNIPFWRYVSTSVLLVLLNLFGTLASCSLVAYAFARLNWPGRSMSFGLMMATMMIPAQVTMIPFFLIIRYLGWYNTLTPLWVTSFFASAFNVFLLHQFFKGIPKDLEDAAKIDGCGPIRSYWYIMLPLVKPSLATVAVFTFMGVWNDFMGPLIYLSDQRLYPLSLGLYALQVQTGNTSMAMLLAGSMLMILPVVLIFFFAQRYFIQGITMTGMKG